MCVSGNRDSKNAGSWDSWLKILSQRNSEYSQHSQSNQTDFKREVRAKGNHHPQGG